ncbi:MAG: hypothetical protein AAGJ34_03010 [Pseudomonadota bacterium]
MKYSNLSATLFVLLSLSVASVSASPVTMRCVLTDTSNSGGWIPQTSVIQYDLSTKKVKLIEPTADRLNGTIVERSSKVVNAKEDRIVLRRQVKNTVDAVGQRAAAFRFSVRYNPQTGSAFVVAKPQGYRNQFTASGRCLTLG